jgi:hypothetical protein
MLCIADILARKVRENDVERMLCARIADISGCYNFYLYKSFLICVFFFSEWLRFPFTSSKIFNNGEKQHLTTGDWLQSVSVYNPTITGTVALRC